MDIQTLQVFAGFTSTAMFVTSNLGNLIYWLYIASLPFGPIWILQGFFTISTALMLLCYLRYERGWGRKMVSLEER